MIGADALVDVGALIKVVWVSVVAGVGVITAFSLVVFGLSRGNEVRRGRSGAAGPSLAFYALAVVGLLVCAWAIWRGYDYVVTKS